MSTVIVSRRIAAPVAAVWALWADFGDVYKWHPFVSKSRLVGNPANTVGVGSERQCDLSDGKNWVRERITDFRPEERMEVEIYEGTMPLRTAVATIAFDSAGEERSRIRLRMDFETKYGVLGRLMVPLLKRQFEKMFSEMLAATEQHAAGPDAPRVAA